MEEKEIAIQVGREFLERTQVKPSIINETLLAKKESPISEDEKFSKILRRTNITIDDIVKVITDEKIQNIFSEKEVCEQIEIDVKYEGYIARQYELVEKFVKLEETKIPTNSIIFLLVFSLNYLHYANFF